MAQPFLAVRVNTSRINKTLAAKGFFSQFSHWLFSP